MTSKQNDKMQNAKHAKIKLPTQSMLRAQKYHKRMKKKQNNKEKAYDVEAKRQNANCKTGQNKSTEIT